MARWITNSPTDRKESRKQAFSALVSYVPTIRGWFGLSARRVTEKAGGGLQAKSVSSSVFLALAVAVGDWMHAVLDLKQSMFLEPPIPKGDRWVEHVRQVYRDYGMNLDALQWEKQSEETSAQYETRLESFANDLVDVFRKQAVTKEALVSGLAKLLPEGSAIEVVEPYTFVKPWPGSSQYQINRIPGETEADYAERLVAYDELYRPRRTMSLTNAEGKPNIGARPNSLYPLPADSPVQVGSFDESTNGVLSKRLSLLKSDLGSYTNLDGSYTRRFFSERNQGGRLEITLSEDLTGAYERIRTLKAAGVHITLYIKQFVGVAAATAEQNPALHEPTMSPVESLGTAISAVPPSHVVVEDL